MTSKDNHTTIYIDSEALENTIVACEKAQSHDIKKYNTSLLQVTLRILILDMRHYLIISIINMVLILILSYYNPENTTLLLCIYCLGQGALIIFELYKSYYYQLFETTSPVYLHHGRMLYFRSAAIGGINTLFFLMLFSAILLFIPEQLPRIIALLLIPIYLLQVIMMYVTPYVHSTIVALTSYSLIMGFSIIMLRRISLDFTLTTSILIFSVILVVYFLSLLRMYYKQKGESHGTYLRTH